MRGSNDPRHRAGPRLWQRQVQVSRGAWRRDEGAGTVRSVGWWESVTVTWSPAAAPERKPTGLQRALETAAEAIVPPLADLAVAGVMRLLERQVRARPILSSYQRYLPSARRELPPPDRAR